MTFEQFLETVNIKESEKQVLKAFRNSLGKESKCCRKLYINGCAGIGKTMLIKNLLSGAEIPIIYWGTEPEKEYACCKTSTEFLEEIKKHESCVAFVDNVLIMAKEPCGCGDLNKEDEKNIYEALNIVNESKNKRIVMASQELIRQSVGIMDRMDVKIKIDLPSINSKIAFMGKICPNLQGKFVDYISRKTIGYTFRDIENIIRVMNCSGKEITLDAIKSILMYYVPAALAQHDVNHITDLDFSRIVSRDSIKDKLNIALTSIKNKEFISQMGIKPKNLLFFYGAPGTGKTFMAKAIAGELGQPIITINASCINSRHSTPNELLKGIMELGTRFGDCILLFDEAEKIFGKSIVGEDEQLQGDLQSYLDGVTGKMKSLIIFTLNEEARFGAALKDRFLMFKFELPTKEERTQFLNKKHEAAKSHFSISASMEELSQEIGDASFREVEKVWDHTLLRKMIANETEIGMDNFMETITMLKSKSGETYFG